MLSLLMLIETEEDRVSFQILYEQTHLKFIHVAKAILHNQNDAEEIVHDVFLKWADDYKSYRQKSLTEMTRLGIVMTRNKCIDLIRRRNAHEEIPIELNDDILNDPKYSTGNDGILDEILTEERVGELADAMRKLTAEEQEILTLRYDLEFSYKKIADIMNLKVQTVKMKLYRIKKKLRKELDHE